MYSSYYKSCIVPHCDSTSKKTPNKLFIYVPNDAVIRKKWLKLARRADVNSLSTKSRMYFCSDHFDLPNDMVNYSEYHLMGKVSRVRMKPGCTPRKFECQEDRKKRTRSSTNRPYILKKQRMVTVAECLKESKESCTPSSSLKDTFDTSLDFQTDGTNVQEVKCEQNANNSVQAFVIPEFRSEPVQAEVKVKVEALSPWKPSIISSSTSPLKAEAIRISSPAVSGLREITKKTLIKEEPLDIDISFYAPSVGTNNLISSVDTLQIKSSGCSEFIAEDIKREQPY